MSPIRRNRFTLVELLVVIAIIGILGAISFGSFTFVQEYIARKQTETMLTNLKDAINNYYQDNSTWPEVFHNEKVCVIITPDGNHEAKPEPGSLTDMKKNVLIKAEDFRRMRRNMEFSGGENQQVYVKDVYGYEIVIRRGATLQKAMNNGRIQSASEAQNVQNKGSFDIFSIGKDGVEGNNEGTNDDIYPLGEDS